VLGVEHWLDPDQQQALTAMKELLREVSDEGRLAPDMITPFASMILGALDEMALAVARAPDPAAALPGARTAVGELLRRILTP
jgi:hypothetical protein